MAMVENYFNMTYSLGQSPSFATRHIARRFAGLPLPLIAVEAADIAINILCTPINLGVKVSILIGKKIFKANPKATWENDWQPFTTLKKVVCLVVGLFASFLFGWSLPSLNHKIHDKLGLVKQQKPHVPTIDPAMVKALNDKVDDAEAKHKALSGKFQALEADKQAADTKAQTLTATNKALSDEIQALKTKKVDDEETQPGSKGGKNATLKSENEILKSQNEALTQKLTQARDALQSKEAERQKIEALAKSKGINIDGEEETAASGEKSHKKLGGYIKDKVENFDELDKSEKDKAKKQAEDYEKLQKKEKIAVQPSHSKGTQKGANKKAASTSNG